MRNRHSDYQPRQSRGFTLVEILIALVIGLFLMGALLTIVQANRTAFGNQNQLAQLQDSERMAMTMMADVIQSAGYFPQPWVNTLSGSLTASGAFAVGQSVYGTYAAGAPGEVARGDPHDALHVEHQIAFRRQRPLGQLRHGIPHEEIRVLPATHDRNEALLQHECRGDRRIDFILDRVRNPAQQVGVGHRRPQRRRQLWDRQRESARDMRQDSILIVLIGNARIHLDSVARHRTNNTTQTQYLCLETRGRPRDRVAP